MVLGGVFENGVHNNIIDKTVTTLVSKPSN